MFSKSLSAAFTCLLAMQASAIIIPREEVPISTSAFPISSEQATSLIAGPNSDGLAVNVLGEVVSIVGGVTHLVGDVVSDTNGIVGDTFSFIDGILVNLNTPQATAAPNA